MTIYTEFDDTNFQFQAAVPIAEAPKDLPKGDIAVGQTPAGKALRFAYRAPSTRWKTPSTTRSPNISTRSSSIRPAPSSRNTRPIR